MLHDDLDNFAVTLGAHAFAPTQTCVCVSGCACVRICVCMVYLFPVK